MTRDPDVTDRRVSDASGEAAEDPARAERLRALQASLTRASDLESPAPRAGGVTPLPWSHDTGPATGTSSGGQSSRRSASRRAGSRRSSSRSASARRATTVGTASDAPENQAPEEAAQVIGGGGHEPEGRRRPGGRRGPAPLPEDPREREEAARSVVLRQLTLGPRSRRQLEEKLEQREAEPELIAKVLDRMEAVHLVDDAAFAETWVRQRHRGKRLSRSALARELKDKGVDQDVAAEALEGIDPGDERAAARDLVDRRLRGRPVPASTTPEGRRERDKVVRRLVGMLGRRGYGPGLALAVVQEALSEAAGA